jgi:hypothetical protein
MNLRRGLFRLWIVGSALFVLAVAFVSYGEIKTAFETAASSKDYWEQQKKIAATQTQRKVVRFRGQLHEFPADMTATEIAAALETTINDPELRPQLTLTDAEVGIFPQNPWASLGWAAAIAFGIPLAVLALGSSLLWALSGFAVQRR